MDLQLEDEPMDAVEKLNNHTHEDIGNPITTGGIADKAVTTEKLANEAVTGEKIKDGEITSKHLRDKSISVDKIADDIAFGGGAYTLKNYIGDGLHIKPAGDLKIKVTAGRCNIDEYQMSLLSDKEIEVKPNTGGLVYLEKTEKYEPDVKIREYELPQPNEWTLVRYTFNGKREDEFIVDSSKNGNDMLVSGKVTVVDGICGNNALEYDGITGYSKT